MVLSNVIMLSQIAGHVVVLTLSLCIIVPMLCHDRDFHGRCLLFATGNWNEDNGLFDVKWPSTFYCNFATVTGFFLFFISSIEIYRSAVREGAQHWKQCYYILFCPNHRRITRLTLKKLEASFLGLFLDVLFGITSCLMTFAAAIMITLGFISWCNDMTQRFPSYVFSVWFGAIYMNFRFVVFFSVDVKSQLVKISHKSMRT